MGTNYYFRGYDKSKQWEKGFDDHIGKRSAAGPFCWDCNITLCKKGNEGIHLSKYEKEWHDKCPKCGKTKTEESLTESSGGRELGFNRHPPKRKTGVASCSSFSWAICPMLVFPVRCNQLLLTQKNADPEIEWPTKIIVDEYDQLFTLAEFKAFLSECPIYYYHIGELFA